MKATKNSIWLLLTHSLFTLFAISALSVFFATFQLFFPMEQVAPDNAFYATMFGSLVAATFTGVYLGGGVLNLKQFYLWKINQHYRSVIMSSYLIIIGLFCLIQIPILYLNLDRSPTVLIVPFCVSIFSSQMVLGKNHFYRVFIPAIPYFIMQLHHIGIHENIIVLIITCSTALLIWAMYTNKMLANNFNSKKLEQDSVSNLATTPVGITPRLVISFNHWLGIILAKKILNSSKDISWAVLMPHTKLLLGSFINLLVVTIFLLLVNNDAKDLLEAFAILILSTAILSVVMESRKLIRQTRYIAHIYSAKQHSPLKRKILLSIDKNFIISCLTFIAGIIFISAILSAPINLSILLLSSLAIILIAYAVYPILLCLSWIKLSYIQVILVCIYMAFAISSVYLIGKNIGESLFSLYFIIFISGCLFLRLISQNIFCRYPIEKLLKNR